MNIGIFGGSFDPVHYGHLALARACQSQADLDEVWFTPAAVQPLKRGGPAARNQDREEMLELAMAGEPSWRVCRLEIDRGGFSYTVDTVLLTAAFMLLTILPRELYANGWLLVKLCFVAAYVLLGILAFRPQRRTVVRAALVAAAGLCFLQVYCIARTHHPLGAFYLLPG